MESEMERNPEQNAAAESSLDTAVEEAKLREHGGNAGAQPLRDTEPLEATRSANECIRIVIVDDHPVVRSGLVGLLEDEADLEVCGEAADITDALEIVESNRPDIVIVDLSLQHGSGLDVISRLAQSYPEIKMLVCSMYDDLLYGERALQAGAHGYIQKREAAHEIVDATRRIAEGRLALSDRLVARLARGRTDDTDSPFTPLSNRELEVLRQIGQGKTVQEIAFELELSPKTVETYRDRLRKKLGIPSSARLVHYAVQLTWTP